MIVRLVLGISGCLGASDSEVSDESMGTGGLSFHDVGWKSQVPDVVWR